MKAIGYTGSSDTDEFILFEQEMPQPTGHDLLVNIQAVSVNPVDTKIRSATKDKQAPPKILGWDASGVVEAIGDKVTLFNVGDRIFYAGDLTRPGSNASHQLVDERIVGPMPNRLSFTEAAALPLTSITAWEALFDRLKVKSGHNILIIGGAGGVGSIAIQLAKQVAGLQVVTTASRDETRNWCFSLGADHVINHHGNVAEQYQALDIDQPTYIFCLTKTALHSAAIAELITPQGMICGIDDALTEEALASLKTKSVGFVWEFMYTRSMFQTEDMIEQHHLLSQISQLIDNNKIQTTLKNPMGDMTVENISKAHKILESGKSIGKIVLENKL